MAALVGENLYEMVPDDDDREVLRGPLGSAVLQTLLASGLLGAKSGQGFYKRAADSCGQEKLLGP